jgi:uncharacterized membrane protein
MNNRVLSVVFSGLFLLLASCRHETDVSAYADISFVSDIQPIIASNCTQSGCHSAQSEEVFSLVTYNDVIDRGEVKAGNAHKSKLYQAVSNHGSEKIMPPPPLAMLTSDQIKLIYLWIEQGAKNN